MSSPLAQAAKHSLDVLRQTFDILPAAAYTCDANGLITYFNKHAEQLWGRTPALNDPADRYCGSFLLFDDAGRQKAHDESWMAQAIRDRREYLAREIVIERPDTTRVVVLSYATPLLAPDGSVASAMNILVNISDRKHVESLLDRARETRDFYRAALADALREQLAPMRVLVRRLSANLSAESTSATHLLELDTRLWQMRNLVNEMVDSPQSEIEEERSALRFRKNSRARRNASQAAAGEKLLPQSTQ
jgi:hypothetical protein